MKVLTFKIGGVDENESRTWVVLLRSSPQYVDAIKDFTAVFIGISIVDGYRYYKNPAVQMTVQVMVPLIKCRQNELRFSIFHVYIIDSSGRIT